MHARYAVLRSQPRPRPVGVGPPLAGRFQLCHPIFHPLVRVLFTVLHKAGCTPFGTPAAPVRAGFPPTPDSTPVPPPVLRSGARSTATEAIRPAARPCGPAPCEPASAPPPPCAPARDWAAIPAVPADATRGRAVPVAGFRTGRCAPRCG